MTLGELQKIFRDKLQSLYDSREANAITKLVFEKVLQVNSLKIAFEKFRILTVAQRENMEQVLERLMGHEPVQYVIGEADFFGLKFKVNHHVLIPRPETEEIVEWIIDENREVMRPLYIMDIGTGTGCIAITLSKYIPSAAITGLDVSEEALQIAAENNDLNGTKVQFAYTDILKDAIPGGDYDIIVSNPPYVLDSERDNLAYNVINFEPHLALFALVNDGLGFYRKIAAKAFAALKPGGRLYFEIHADKALEISQLLEEAGYRNITVRKDLGGKDRMVRGEK